MMEMRPRSTARPSSKLLRLLAEKYPTRESVYEKLIYLQSRLSLPKGVEHFMSDLHGEYDTFYHILNNCSGVIREKVEYVFGERMSAEEKAEFCTLIYYPKEKIEQIHADRRDSPDWYLKNLGHLLELSKLMSYKYPASEISTFIPKRYASVIVELMNTRPEADQAQFVYLKKLLSSIVQINSGAAFIEAFTALIKRLAVDHLHIVGDFFDRGGRPDAILNRLMEHSSVDIQWGNHDILWMGAAMGSELCIAGVVRNCLHYHNTDVLERGYGISLRPLTTFASHIYPDEHPLKGAERAIAMIMFKLEGQMIRRNPDFHMESRLLLDKIDFRTCTITLGDGTRHELDNAYFPTIDPDKGDLYQLTEREQEIIDDLKSYFMESAVLQKHLDYLYTKGSVYTEYNGNLLFHGCVLLNEDGSLRSVLYHNQPYRGRDWFDFCDTMARRAYLYRHQEELDFMYFLWCGRLSPISGREVKTFERSMLSDETTWQEPSDPYYRYINDPYICEMILKEFGLDLQTGHIVNGHVPVKVKKGETPIKAGGKVIVIDGGFCKAYHKKTGISGYTLISNSRGMRLLEHKKIADVREALRANRDIESVSETIELQSYHKTVSDTDEGYYIQDEITDLYSLLLAYQNGTIKPLK